MKLSLHCTINMQEVLRELLSGRGIEVEEEASVCLVEAGCDVPEDKIAILFDIKNLGCLIELLDKLGRVGKDCPNTMIGKSKDESYQIIALPKVFYFEARGNNVFCIAAAASDKLIREYKIKEKLYELEVRLPQNHFLRVGKSYIVNIDNVNEIIPWFGRRLILRFVDGKREIEVSRNYVKNLKEFLGM
jgi:two-component system, LytTR family, response regulator